MWRSRYSANWGRHFALLPTNLYPMENHDEEPKIVWLRSYWRRYVGFDGCFHYTAIKPTEGDHYYE